MISNEAAPAIVFLILYAFMFIFLTTLYFQRKINWKSRYSFVYFHVILRLAAQALGLAFGLMSWDNFDVRLNVLIAYLVLGAEGYFSLVLCAYRFLIVWQEQRLGKSSLEPLVLKGTPFKERWKLIRRSPILFIHYLLAGANGMIIAGGSMLSAALSNSKTPNPNDIHTGKVLRVVGTGIFLALVQIFFILGILSYKKKGDITLFIILLTWPFLTVRGVYGILSIVNASYSYYNPDVYSENGMTSTFLVGEYVLCTTMEWISCALLLSTYFLPHESGVDHPDNNSTLEENRDSTYNENGKAESI